MARHECPWLPHGGFIQHLQRNCHIRRCFYSSRFGSALFPLLGAHTATGVRTYGFAALTPIASRYSTIQNSKTQIGMLK